MKEIMTVPVAFYIIPYKNKEEFHIFYIKKPKLKNFSRNSVKK